MTLRTFIGAYAHSTLKLCIMNAHYDVLADLHISFDEPEDIDLERFDYLYADMLLDSWYIGFDNTMTVFVDEEAV